MHLRYYAPYYDEKVHRNILKLLEDIKRKHGIEYGEISVKHWFPEWYSKKAEMSEAYVYEHHLKPYSTLILSNCNKLIQMGLNLHCDTVSSKFKSRKYLRSRDSSSR